MSANLLESATADLQQHPLSAAFPAMPDEEFQALKDSIESIGVQNPIVLFEGMVLDGWHRYRAAKETISQCPAVDLADDVDPKDFVIAQNERRPPHCCPFDSPPAECILTQTHPSLQTLQHLNLAVLRRLRYHHSN